MSHDVDEDTHKLLTTWLNKCSGYRWLHLRSHMYFVKWNNYISIPILVLSTTIGMCSFSLVSPDKPNSVGYCFQIIFAIGNVIVAVFTAIHRYSSYPERIEQHKKSSIEYTKIYREIYMELTLPSANLVSFSRYILSRYDKLNQDAPDVPQCIVKEFNKRFPTLIHRPDLCNGLFDLEQGNCSQFDVDGKTSPYGGHASTDISSTRDSMEFQKYPIRESREFQKYPIRESREFQKYPIRESMEFQKYPIRESGDFNGQQTRPCEFHTIAMSPNRYNTSLIYFSGQTLDLNQHSDVESKSTLYFVHRSV